MSFRFAFSKWFILLICASTLIGCKSPLTSILNTINSENTELPSIEDISPSPIDTSVTGCDCGSTDSNAPCIGNSVLYSRSMRDFPASNIQFEFQCDGGPCACGKFANEYDYWVAPITENGQIEIVGMSPAATGAADATLRSGWVSNPSAAVESSMMDGRLGQMTLTGQPLNPSASDPFVINTAQSPRVTIVKSHSMLETGATNCRGSDPATGLSRHCFWFAGVLTALNTIPENAGSTIFRPPLTGDEKPLIPTSAINHNLLPKLPFPRRQNGDTVTVSWDDALDFLAPPKVEWGARGNVPFWQYMPPMFNFGGAFSGYPSGMFAPLTNALQLLSIDDTNVAEKKKLLTVRAVQWGLDYYFMWKALGYGSMYRPNGGHAVGRYLPTLIAAGLMTGPLGDQMKFDMQRVNQDPFTGDGSKCGFSLTGEIFNWSSTGRTLFGYYNIPGCSGYSTYLVQTNSNYVDANFRGDNGRLAENADNGPGNVASCRGAYQAITVGPTHSAANLVLAIPALRPIAFDHLISYVDRVFDNGYQCRDDHIANGSAPYDRAFGVCEGGSNPGEQCITDSYCQGGGTCVARNNTQYTSWLARNMWDKYRQCYTNKTCSGMEGL